MPLCVCVTFISTMKLTFLMALMAKNLSAMQKTQVRSLCWEDSLEKKMATHSGILAWEIPWTREWGLVGYIPWGHEESDTTEQLTL